MLSHEQDRWWSRGNARHTRGIGCCFGERPIQRLPRNYGCHSANSGAPQFTALTSAQQVLHEQIDSKCVSCSSFFDIDDLNRDVESSMEFFCGPICYMHFAAWFETQLNLEVIVRSWAHTTRKSRQNKNSLRIRRVLKLTRAWQRAQWEQWVTVFRVAHLLKAWAKLTAMPNLVCSSSSASVASLISLTDSSVSDNSSGIGERPIQRLPRNYGCHQRGNKAHEISTSSQESLWLHRSHASATRRKN